ncbi:hypothetical protein Misp01_25520 [Microtetraspora sp. NBRC 13810]|uniref:hypothetical protein n=1 Tax=Microtetraspora sp. NBRC 13810 TaxID=3030990 RepID=UPI00249FE1D1|nr:hypothetical protein [Microtetraspora sp. NBRC 13810]GLW07422.1 hypothetical protein Misp01_25520 [Microtetraspora sp. NBRC 13810]
MARQAGDRRVVFVGLVVVLAAVGIYLTIGGTGGGESEAEPVAEQAAQSQGARQEQVTAPEPTVVPTASGAPFDIYSFLPMTKEQLSAAADIAQRFTAAYGTYRFDEDPAAYATRLQGFTTAELGADLARTVTSPGTIEQNRAEQLVATGSAQVKEIREIDRSSVIFVVTGTRQVTTKAGPANRTEEWAVTLTQVGDGWRVYDIQPADAGQEGDPGTGAEGVE